MSIVNSCTITNPYGKEDECAQFTIDNLTTAFAFNDIMVPGQDYTFSFWAKSGAVGSVIVGGSSFPTSTEWGKHAVTFNASAVDLYMAFGTIDTYYIYHPQLENGTLATDWTPAPEDVDEGISDAAGTASSAKKTADENAESVKGINQALVLIDDKFSTLVKGPDGQTLMTQDENGWTFSMSDYMQPYKEQLDETASKAGDLEDSLDDTNDAVNKLDQAVEDIGNKTSYIHIGEYNDMPCIELGDGASTFKVRITNVDIQFIDGTTVPAYISNQKLMIEQAEVKNELQFGGFVWKTRSNGNMGIVWKGASS